MMSFTLDSTVGTIAASHPLATRVFARHGIDFCCGGGRSISAACRARKVDPHLVLEELAAELQRGSPYAVNWQKAPLSALIDHILLAHHVPLKEELPRLEAMLTKVAEVHRERDPLRLPEALAVLRGLRAELEQHMTKEEVVLFPMIRRGQGAHALGPVAVMEQEHEECGAALQRLRALTDDYTAPAEACTTWRALLFGLAALESGLHEHIHLENNILFPRALAGEGHSHAMA